MAFRRILSKRLDRPTAKVPECTEVVPWRSQDKAQYPQLDRGIHKGSATTTGFSRGLIAQSIIW